MKAQRVDDFEDDGEDDLEDDHLPVMLPGAADGLTALTVLDSSLLSTSQPSGGDIVNVPSVPQQQHQHSEYETYVQLFDEGVWDEDEDTPPVSQYIPY